MKSGTHKLRNEHVSKNTVEGARDIAAIPFIVIVAVVVDAEVLGHLRPVHNDWPVVTILTCSLSIMVLLLMLMSAYLLRNASKDHLSTKRQ